MFDSVKAAFAGLGKYKWYVVGAAVVVLGIALYGGVEVPYITE